MILGCPRRQNNMAGSVMSVTKEIHLYKLRCLSKRLIWKLLELVEPEVKPVDSAVSYLVSLILNIFNISDII